MLDLDKLCEVYPEDFTKVHEPGCEYIHYECAIRELCAELRASRYVIYELCCQRDELVEALKNLLHVAPSIAPGAGVIVGAEKRHKEAIQNARLALANLEADG